jgi:general secretion pathway protein K
MYRSAGLTYQPRQGSFPYVAELWLVLGLPPALVERAMALVTVFSGRAAASLGRQAAHVGVPPHPRRL